MATGSDTKRAARQQRLEREETARAAARARGLRNRVLVSVGGAVALLAAIFLISAGGSSSGGGSYAFAVGSPGAGQPAPPIQLANTQGGHFDLAAQHGKTVLLYFQEGLTCQPCWDQLKDLNRASSQLKAMGINELVSVTTDPLANLRQKASDEGLTTPVLSDPNLAASQSYGANRYGMMGASRDGHTFIIVGPDGHIRWRADYGGAPNYTMYVPVSHLLADLRKGLSGGA